MPSNRFDFSVVVLVTGLLSSSVCSEPASTETTHCRTDEHVYFSCEVGTKTVSLCASGTAGEITSLAYRYGAIGKVENEFVACPGNKNRFYGTVSPAGPGALVSQVWFDRGDIRYLLTECIGGNCPHNAGLAVLQGNRLLMNRRCERSAENDLAWFSRDLVTFGSDVADSQSATELLQIEDADNEIYRIYNIDPEETE